MSQPRVDTSQLLRKVAPAGASVAASLAGLAGIHFAHSAWVEALVMAPAFAWLPASLFLVQQARSEVRMLAAADAARLADQQVERFRSARRDPLTGLSNRQAFLDTIAAQFARHGSFALLLIDPDGFDHVNANVGEATGDEVLAALAGRIQSACADRDHAARLDGDGFAMLLTHPDSFEPLAPAAARLLAEFSAPKAAGGQLVDVPVSIGVALAPMHGQTAEALLQAARDALAEAKRAGGGRWHVCGQVTAGELRARHGMRVELQRAIEAGQIVPYYQPIIDLKTGLVAKFEVLARWIHPREGVLLPDQFIPAADDMGLSGQISMSLLRQVAQDCQDWPSWCRFSINVSPGQVRELIWLLNTQPGAWQRRLDLSRLEVEMSEEALIRDQGLARELIDVLHEHGARAVLDNFGTGASNFFHLHDTPFDSIKVGKIFVQTMGIDPRAEACVLSMLWLGLGLGIDIVADGVETKEVADQLAGLGCHFAQGYLYARPMGAAEASKMVGVREAA